MAPFSNRVLGDGDVEEGLASLGDPISCRYKNSSNSSQKFSAQRRQAELLPETQLMTMVWPEARRVANLEISCRGMSLIKFRALVSVMDPAWFRLSFSLRLDDLGVDLD